jgi:hypothetical protein
MLSGLSQLLSRSSSASPPLGNGEEVLDSKGQGQYGDMLPTTTTGVVAVTGTLDTVTSVAAAGVEDV